MTHSLVRRATTFGLNLSAGRGVVLPLRGVEDEARLSRRPFGGAIDVVSWGVGAGGPDSSAAAGAAEVPLSVVASVSEDSVGVEVPSGAGVDVDEEAAAPRRATGLGLAFGLGGIGTVKELVVGWDVGLVAMRQKT